MNRPSDRIASIVDPTLANDEPMVLGLVRTGEGLALGRRAFFGGLAAGSMAAPTVAAQAAQTGVDAKRCATVGLRSHTAAVSSVAFDGSGRWLVTASVDRSAKLWSVVNRSVSKTLQSPSAISAVAFAGDARRLITTGGDREMHAWVMPDGRPGPPQRGSSPITALAISPDGSHLAVGGDDGTIQLLSQPDGRPAAKWQAHDALVRSIVFSPDGRSLFSAEAHEPIRMWAIPSGTQLGTLGKTLGARAEGLEGINSIAVSRDGSLLASGGRTDSVKLWSLADKRLLREFAGGPYRILALALTPDGKQLAAGGSGSGIGSDRDIRLWVTREVRSPLRLEGHVDSVHALAFSPDGAWLASGSADHSAILWPMPIDNTNACLWDEAATWRGTQVNRIRQMGAATQTLPCGTPLPADAICQCDCVGASHTYRGTQTVCNCDTVVVPMSVPKGVGTVCTCNSVSVGSHATPIPAPAPAPPAPRPVPRDADPRSGTDGYRSGGTTCTCNTVHYWRPN